MVGGPQGDCGLTGRKIIVDTYGGAAPHGGGAFSGKDPSKGRSFGGVCRALRGEERRGRGPRGSLPGAGLVCHRHREAHQHHGHHLRTGKISDEKIEALIARHFDLRPKGIVQMLDLLRPIYRQTAAYGHFGRNEAGFSWEKTDKAAALAADAGVKVA